MAEFHLFTKVGIQFENVLSMLNKPSFMIIWPVYKKDNVLLRNKNLDHVTIIQKNQLFKLYKLVYKIRRQ